MSNKHTKKSAVSQGAKNKKGKKITIAAVSLLTISGGVLAFTLLHKPKETPYNLYTVKSADPLSLKGTVEPLQVQEIYLDAAKGTIGEVAVTNGQEVTAGTPILNYQNEQVQEELTTQQQTLNKNTTAAAQADENVAAAQTAVGNVTQRITKLQQKINTTQDEAEKSVLDEQMSGLQTELQGANDQLRQARQASQTAYEEIDATNQILTAQKERASETVSANIDGIATVDEKGKTSPEVPVVTLSSKTKEVKGIVTEYDLDKLAVGQPVEITTIGSNQNATGTIKAISNAAVKTNSETTQTTSYQFDVEGNFPWPDDLSTLITVKQDQLILPNSAIKKDHGKEYVFQYTAGKAKRVPIKTQELDGRKILESGLTKGSKIIENPDQKVKSGETIQVSRHE